MKKALIMFCMAMSLFATSAFAQLKEVRGVQTRSVQYTGYDEDNRMVEKWGYELKNENNYDVWVELELKTTGFTYGYSDTKVQSGVRDTKNITLKAGETYVWKCGDRMRFISSDYHEKFYVTYKAYKVE
ncbi:MAG: hypothetical protein IJM88_03595 [Bacteroidales bacterium]|nr:hypothetical protein [Bacteroidales bacterium]